MKLSKIKVNGKAIEGGAWVSGIPELEGVRLKVRGLRNTAHRRLEAKLSRDIPREDRLNGIDPAAADAIESECLAKTVLLDWSGIEGDDGKPIPYSDEIGLQYLSDPDYLVLRNGVVYAATIVTTAKAEDQKVDAGN